ncbi:MAG: histidine phosphatase family protein [Deltaproteobacteria bacterium]|nr:histidine phosphatase family protein [Deltaproteobacteria bacterium]
MIRRRIILMRHAKSAWNQPDLSDHARPLKKRGRKDASTVAARLVALGWVPDETISSDAARAQETVQRMQPFFDPEPPVTFQRTLYHCGMTDVETTLRLLSARVETVLLVGHNPAWEEVLFWLTGLERQLKTAHAALLDLELKKSSVADTRAIWSGLVPPAHRWHLRDVVTPR